MKSTDIQKLNCRHRRLLELFVYSGLTNREIARLCGYNEEYLSRLKRTPLFLAELRRLTESKERAERELHLQSLASPALGLLHQMLTAGKVTFDNGQEMRINSRVLFESIRDVLDRAGHVRSTQREDDTSPNISEVIEAAWLEPSREIPEALGTELLCKAPTVFREWQEPSNCIHSDPDIFNCVNG